MNKSNLSTVMWLLMILSLVPVSFIIEPAGAADVDNAIAVIVNERNPTQKMTAREIRKLFLGKSRKLPDGTRAVLVSLASLQSEFNSEVLGKKDSQVKSAWARLQFAGRARPPHEFTNVTDLVKFVANNDDAIAYVPVTAISHGVRAVHIVD